MEYLAELMDNLPAWPFIIIGSLIGILGAFAVQRYIARLHAAETFRAIINPDTFIDLKSHQLHAALLQSLPAFKSAICEFRIRLNRIERIGLDKAWNAYHGGNKDTPDFFVMYCIPENGPDLLKHRLENLRKFGEKR